MLAEATVESGPRHAVIISPGAAPVLDDAREGRGKRSLTSSPYPISTKSVRRNGEADVLQVEVDLRGPSLTSNVMIRSATRGPEGGGCAAVREAAPGIDDVFDDQDVAIREVEVEVFMMPTMLAVRVVDPYDETAMKSNSTGRSMARAGGHEHERALENSDEERGIVV